MTKAIAILGEYTPTFTPHIATNEAIKHVQKSFDITLIADWITTEEIDSKLFDQHAGIWVAPGSPYKNMEKTLWAIRYARENKIPCFGTCGGFQHMIIEYARNVLGYHDAQHAEYDPYFSSLFIAQLDCSLAGRELQLNFVSGSQVAKIYNSCSATEQYYCNFGINPNYYAVLRQGPLVISGCDAEGEIRVIEHPEHPFFIGTLFVPQTRSTPETPHPLVSAFLQAVATHAR